MNNKVQLIKTNHTINILIHRAFTMDVLSLSRYDNRLQ